MGNIVIVMPITDHGIVHYTNKTTQLTWERTMAGGGSGALGRVCGRCVPVVKSPFNKMGVTDL